MMSRHRRNVVDLSAIVFGLLLGLILAALLLPLAKAQADAKTPAIDAVLKQDIEDLTALEVTKTPTFFVNGRGLPSFGDQQLMALVAEEVAKARK